MKRQTKVLILLVGVIALLLAIRFALFGQPSDREQIANALAESIRASKEGRPGGVIEYLSPHFKINEENPGSSQRIGKFIRDNRPDIEVRNTEPVISGDKAEIDTSVKVTVQLLSVPLQQEIPNVKIHFQKESGLRWLVFPVKDWKIASVEAPEVDLSQFMDR